MKLCVKEIRYNGMEWNQSAQDRVQYRALVNMVIELQVPKKARNFFIS
jgi:hypothetical protein